MKRGNPPEHTLVSMKKLYRVTAEIDDAVGAVVEELKKRGICKERWDKSEKWKKGGPKYLPMEGVGFS